MQQAATPVLEDFPTSKPSNTTTPAIVGEIPAFGFLRNSVVASKDQTESPSRFSIGPTARTRARSSTMQNSATQPQIEALATAKAPASAKMDNVGETPATAASDISSKDPPRKSRARNSTMQQPVTKLETETATKQELDSFDENQPRLSSGARNSTASATDSTKKPRVRRSTTQKPVTTLGSNIPEDSIGLEELDTLGFPASDVPRPPMTMRPSVSDSQRPSRTRSSTSASTRPDPTADSLLLQLRSAAVVEEKPKVVEPTTSRDSTSQRGRSSSIAQPQRPSLTQIGVQPPALVNLPSFAQMAMSAEQKNLSVNRPSQSAATQRRLQQNSSLGKAGGKSVAGPFKRPSVHTSEFSAVSAFANSNSSQPDTPKSEVTRTKFGAEFFEQVLKDGPFLVNGFPDGLFQLSKGWDTKGNNDLISLSRIKLQYVEEGNL